MFFNNAKNLLPPCANLTSKAKLYFIFEAPPFPNLISLSTHKSVYPHSIYRQSKRKHLCTCNFRRTHLTTFCVCPLPCFTSFNRSIHGSIVFLLATLIGRCYNSPAPKALPATLAHGKYSQLQYRAPSCSTPLSSLSLCLSLSLRSSLRHIQLNYVNEAQLCSLAQSPRTKLKLTSLKLRLRLGRRLWLRQRWRWGLR